MKGYLEAPAILAAAQATVTDNESALQDAMTKADAANKALESLTATLAKEQAKLAELQAEYETLKEMEIFAEDNVIATLLD